MRSSSKKFLIITFITSLLIIISFAESKTNSPDADDYNKSILLKNAKIDTSVVQKSKAVQNISISNYQIKEEEFYLVQFKGYIHEEWKQALRDSGAVLYDYVPNNAFIARMNSSVKTQVETLDPVQWVGSYQPGYRVSQELSSSSVIDSREILIENITVLLFDARDNERVLSEITGLGGEMVSNSGDRIRISIERTKISGISQINGVSWIEKYVPPVLLNDVAANITGSYPVRDTHGLTGSGQIVAVADTGLDTGVNDNTMHADIRGRIAAIHAWWSEYGDNGAGDNNGHGTHVAGSVLGNGSQSSGQYAGMAPGASLVFQAMQYDGPDPLMNGGLYIPTDLSSLFQEAYNDGAKIHSNSWGSDIPALYGSYTSDSRYVDSFMWNNPDMLIVFAAGNEGIYGDNTVTPPATAKNAISVGASENFRIEKGGNSDNINDIAYFSSRGFTDDNRIKPDIVAPGTYIISTRSSKPGASYPFGILDPYYAYGSGTSMSTPIVAGTAALVREYFVENKSISPSAALIKAVLINGAINLGLPKNDQGWGRVDIEKSLFPASPRTVRYYDNNTGLSTSQSWNVSYEVSNSSEPLRVTLVWSDYPGAPYAGITLVNNLDLAVSGPGGTYHGNGAPDIRNNVEEVELIFPSTGAYTISVNGTNIPQGPQPFALVISGAIDAMPPFAGSEFPDYNSYTNNNTTSVAVSITDRWSPVNLSSINMTINGVLAGFTNTTITDGYRIQNITTSPYDDGMVNVSVNATNNDSKLLTYSWSFVVDTHSPQVTINPVSYERGTAAKTNDIIEFNISAIDPVINGTSSGIKNASVDTFQINNTGTIELANNSGYWKGNVTIDKLIIDGNYSLKVSFSDNAGNTNNSERINITMDNNPPSVNSVSLDSYLVETGGFVNVLANITDNFHLNTSDVNIRIKYPDGTTTENGMTYQSPGNSFIYTFSDTAQYGRFSIAIIASDTTGNTITENTWFVTTKSNLSLIRVYGSHNGTAAVEETSWDTGKFPGMAVNEMLNVQNVSNRIVTQGNLWFNTTTEIVNYPHIKDYPGLLVDNGLDINGNKVAQGGYYAKIGWQGIPYVAFNGKANKTSLLILEQSSQFDKKNLRTNEMWDMGEGYTLKVVGIDTSSNPRMVWLNLSKNGIGLDDAVVARGVVYNYSSSIAGETDVPLFVTYVDSIFAGESSDFVQLKYTWLVSNNITQINSSDTFGNMRVVESNASYLNLTNSNNISLVKNSNVEIIDKLHFRVTDNSSLEYYPYFETPVFVNAAVPSDVTLEISRDTGAIGSVKVTKYLYMTPKMNASLPLTAISKYISIRTNNNLINNNTWLKFKIYYTKAELDLSNLDESSLKIAWNNKSDIWEILGSQQWVYGTGVDATDTGGYAGYVWANVSNLVTYDSDAFNSSTFDLGPFVLVGKAPSIKNNIINSGGGGGGGGGGGASGENFTNIEVTEKYDLSIYKDKTTSYRFKNDSNPIVSVNITGNISFGDITTSVEVLRNNSTMVSIAPPEIVYKNANIWVGSSSFNSPRNIKQGVIRFRVKNAWIDENNIARIRMVRWNKIDWEDLETNEIEKDDLFTYYDAFARTFSNFAIIGTKEVKVKEISAAALAAPVKYAATGTPAADSTKNMSGFEFSILMAAFCAVYLLKWKRK